MAKWDPLLLFGPPFDILSACLCLIFAASFKKNSLKVFKAKIENFHNLLMKRQVKEKEVEK